ncbi:MAG: methyltransferase protein [Alphaproteobacteria bacterium]|nr:methyltransferase protein [Alphaproteobacteria bacterium]
MEADGPFDRQMRRLRRDRAAGRFGTADYLHRLTADELLERLGFVRRSFARALALGCGDDYPAARLRERGIAVTQADAGFAFAGAGGVQCDEDFLPFADGSFDLIVSIGALDSVNDLPGALLLIRRALRPDGLFLGAMAGAGSLPRLKAAMLAADDAEGGAAAPRIHPQIDLRAAGDLLTRAGFALPVVDAHGIDVRFAGLLGLVRDLRAMGGTNLLRTRPRKPLGRLGLAAAAADFAAHAAADGKTAERFEILHLLGWAPAPDQPKPARRGSATMSLATALKPRSD